MSFYDRLGVRRVINAGTTFTALGGTLMPPEVLDAMRDAAGAFVDMHELHIAAGRRLAALTHNDAAYVTSGCAAALVLGVLAARTSGDPRLIDRKPDAPGVPDEVIMHAAHRIPYDPAVRLAGASIRQIGNAQQTFDWELDATITERTAAVLYVAGSHLARGALPLEEVVRIAHERQVPIIVDAAAQLPPVDNLWRFTVGAGADLAVFSGGKALHGPQASGLMVGRADLVEAARQNGAPFQRVARALKAGKEEIAVLPNEVAGRCGGFWIGPDLLRPGEAGIVAAAIRRHLCAGDAPKTGHQLIEGRTVVE
jgi:L-seryl-tRNA(Ser) seleniumtransferase